MTGNGVVIATDTFSALPINVVGSANITYSVEVRSGSNVSVYMINQDQLANLESRANFPSYPALTCLDINQVARSGNMSSGSYYLVIVNGLSVNSTGPATVDYQLTVGGQTGQMTLIGWMWSIIALASTVGMAIGAMDLSRERREKKARPKRSKKSRRTPKSTVFKLKTIQ